MIKKYKKQLIISSILIVLPILIGLILWKALPDQFATHWGIDGEADGWSTKAFAVFAAPLLLLATHWFCFWVTTKDPKAKNQNKKALGMIFWIVPCISLFSSAVTYSLALGAEFNISSIMFAGLGLMFICIGNYLPKCKHNFTLGIKTPWALASEENWNVTHRFGGRVWVIGGLLILPLSFVPMDWAMVGMLILVIVMTLVPMLYSYLFYKTQKKSGNVQVFTSPYGKWSLLIVAAFLIFLFFVLFTGSIEYEYGDTSFLVDSDRWDSLTVRYDTIDSIEYREEMVSGSREWGFGSPKLLMGQFKNDEFGYFTRYTYSGCENCIVLSVDGKYIVLSGADAAETQAIYAELVARTEG